LVIVGGGEGAHLLMCKVNARVCSVALRHRLEKLRSKALQVDWVVFGLPRALPVGAVGKTLAPFPEPSPLLPSPLLLAGAARKSPFGARGGGPSSLCLPGWLHGVARPIDSSSRHSSTLTQVYRRCAVGEAPTIRGSARSGDGDLF
jgi:hypothetical protein